MGIKENAEVGSEKTYNADTDAWPKIVANDLGVDLGSGEERQHDRAEASEEIDPGRDLKADDVAGDGADDDLDECDRDATRIEMIDAASARPIHTAEASQTFSMRTFSLAKPWRPASNSERERARKRPLSAAGNSHPYRRSRAVGVHQPSSGG